jgi:hypothetical protein
MFDPLTIPSFYLVSHRVTVLMLNQVRRLINRAARRAGARDDSASAD